MTTVDPTLYKKEYTEGSTKPFAEMTWYLGGPMTGYPEYNFPAFAQAKDTITEQWGMKVVSAHEVDHGAATGNGQQPYREYLRGDLAALLQCDGAIFLQGWPDSRGAKLEFEIACDLEFPIFQFCVVDEVQHMLIALRRKEFYS